MVNDEPDIENGLDQLELEENFPCDLAGFGTHIKSTTAALPASAH